MARLIAIGDIHGCNAALQALLEVIDLQEGDRVVTLGDYVDRGPDSRGVIETLLQLEAAGQLVAIAGNHEEMMLGALRRTYPWQYWLRHGGVATLDSYGFVGDLSVVPKRHVDFIDRCLPYYETDDVIFTHANYVSDEPMDRQPAEVLRWQSLLEHFPAQHYSGKRVFVGHTSQKRGNLIDVGYLVCLDTYCHGGGWLTAQDVQSGQRWQASAEGELRS